jgi:hypothetical protein
VFNYGISHMKNVGGMDRLLRALFGSSFVLIDFFATIQLEIVFLIVGLWGVLTSALGYCPFNGLMGRNTCAIKYNEATNDAIAADLV